MSRRWRAEKASQRRSRSAATDLGHAFDDHPDWMRSTLTNIDATGTVDSIELVKLVRGGTRDHVGHMIIDFTVADACLGKLYERLRDELQRVLEIQPFPVGGMVETV